MIKPSLDRLVRTVKPDVPAGWVGAVSWEKSFDRQEAVRAAQAVFWQRGYTASSLAQLMAATGLSKSSLYETFGSKRGLFDEAMQNYLHEVMEPLLSSLEARDATRADLLNWFQTFAAVFRGKTPYEARNGCLMLNTAMELDGLDEVAELRINHFRLRVRAAMFNALRSLDTDAARLSLWADTLSSAHSGMIITSRMDPLAAAQFADTLAADIAGW